MKIEPGNVVLFESREFEILRITDMTSILGRDLQTRKVKNLLISELRPCESTSYAASKKIRTVTDLSEEDWETAKKRFDIIAPIINNEHKVNIAGIAKEAGVGRATIFRWLKRFRQTACVTSLAKDQHLRGKGKTRLSEETEAIVKWVIEERYLTRQKLSVKKISIEIAAKCRTATLEAPHYQTIRNRIKNISEEQQLARRYHRSMAINKFKPLEGSFPGADYPLAAVQIDHTPLDILVVDEANREPVGKPWVTMAIDVFSRMITGFYISLDPPGALGTGLCLSHAILPKELWLTDLDIAGKWPCYGIMRAIYMDNAREFHGKMLERACQEYGIEINFRPVATPNYGGHIERLLGTVLRELHTLPGTTFSNVNERKHYQSGLSACFTIKELEKWLVTFIVNVYHQRLHGSIHTTPYARYCEGILGSPGQIGVGLSRPIENELKLKLDFMPFVERSVQRYGVVIDFICYYHDILRKWVRAYAQPNTRYKALRKFMFKRDPRDISAIYFFDPEIRDYFCIPYRNTGHPAITIWEHRKILRDIKAKGIGEVDEEMIFEAYERLKYIEETAVGTTAAAKRLRNKARKTQATIHSIRNEFGMNDQGATPEIPTSCDRDKIILPFEDLDDEAFK